MSERIDHVDLILDVFPTHRTKKNRNVLLKVESNGNCHLGRNREETR